ncbi:hypothetical protein [Paludisphaera mucosa]|uniref:Uncharacterized protein n=1 Tax=Paludisphaera mucosa TaxID=3030827 RepID=A0ABT6FBL2_9BACT|nr:hypothetical protein [Paludisphaera mucosa]MDG3004988.1 hypothetical protein [Paludisphaera mucosa]
MPVRPSPLGVRLLPPASAALLVTPSAEAQRAAAPRRPRGGKRLITQYGAVLRVDGKPFDDGEGAARTSPAANARPLTGSKKLSQNRYEALIR